MRWLILAAAIGFVLAPAAAAADLDVDELRSRIRALPPLHLEQPPVVEPAPTNPFGLGWGGGFAFSSNLVGVPLVEEGDAFIDENNIIRITHPRNVKARILLESHYTFRLMGSSVALGPVIFIQPSGVNLFDAAGGGLMLELGEGETSFNLMAGILLDFDVSRLHRDYVDGFKSPTSELVYVRREELQFLVGFAVGR